MADDPVVQLRALQAAICTVRCNKQSKMLYAVVNQHLTALAPVLEEHLAVMKEAAAFGQTLKQSQTKELKEFADALLAITNELMPISSSSSSGGGSSAGTGGGISCSSGGSFSSSKSSSTSGVRPSASGRKPVLPEGVSSLNPDSLYYVKEKLVGALAKLHAAFKSSHPQLAKALSAAKNEVEDVGLFEDM